MDILAICGSPRTQKTTHSVLRALLDGVGCSADILWPAKMNIGHCTGCLTCKKITPGVCWQNDDMKEAIEKMFAAKALVVASPTYFGNVPGPLKNFIDRSIPTCYTGKGDFWQGAPNHGTRPFKGRPAVIIAVAGGADYEKTAAHIRLVLEYYEYRVIGQFAEGMGGVIVERDTFPDIYNELFALGGQLSEAVNDAG